MASLDRGASAVISTVTSDNQWVLRGGSSLTLAQGGGFSGEDARIYVLGQSTLTIAGGNTGSIFGDVIQASQLLITGGSVDGRWWVGGSQTTATISGGRVTGRWILIESATLIVQGSNLGLLGEHWAPRINGTLKDGTPIDLTVMLGPPPVAQIILQNS